MVAGLIMGGLVTVAGLVTLDSAGPTVLIVGLIVLAFGGAAFFTRQRQS